MEKLWGDEIFLIFVVIVSQVCTLVKSDRVTHLRYLHFIVFQLHLNKNFKNYWRDIVAEDKQKYVASLDSFIFEHLNLMPCISFPLSLGFL